MTLHPGFRFPAEEEDFYNPVDSFTGIRKYMTLVHHHSDGRMVHEVMEENTEVIEQTKNLIINREREEAFGKGMEEAFRNMAVNRQMFKDDILDYVRANMDPNDPYAEQEANDALARIKNRLKGQ